MNTKIIDNYKCIFSSRNLKIENKYIQSSKFILSNSFLIINNKSIVKYNYDYNDKKKEIESIKLKNEFNENNYIYDYGIIDNGNIENQYIFLCSKDNPIRILNNELSIVKSFTLENKMKEKFLSPIFIKYDKYGINIFTGNNFLSKIDLIKQKELFIKFNKNYNYLSCFDFNPRYSCYFIGSYSQNLLISDYKTDKIIEIYKHELPINEINILNTRNYQILIGYRNSDYMCLYDIRKMNKFINKLERNALTTKKINFILDKDENDIYCGNLNGNIIRYSFENEIEDNINVINQDKFSKEEINLGINNSISSLDLEDNKKLLMVTYGNRNNLIINSLDNIDEMDENLIKNKDNGEFGFNIYQL